MVGSVPLDTKHLDIEIMNRTTTAGGCMWDPGQYLKYADERGRPFADLISRVAAERPGYVVDLGCGPGNLTATLIDRWPTAYVEGVDSSAEMIEKATAVGVPGRLDFHIGDLRQWEPHRSVDVLVSNATLQWVPDHIRLLPKLVRLLAPDGWLAFQVPGNFGEPSHQILRDLAGDARWGLGDIAFPTSHQPVEYVAALAAAGCRVDVWETTYLHILSGTDPVFEWISGTGARPVLAALGPGARAEFSAVFKARLRGAYPPRDYGTVLPFRRIFAVARK
jgi:trans-aconitate 2-methyltransferase